MAEILADLDLDQEAIAAAIVYEGTQYADLSLDDIREQLGNGVADLVSGVERMEIMSHMRKSERHDRIQLDNLRRMLLAMVDDVRVVLIKFAERLQVMRAVRHLSDNIKQPIAREVMDL